MSFSSKIYIFIILQDLDYLADFATWKECDWSSPLTVLTER